MTWRPEDWELPFKEAVYLNIIYESGADAMYNAMTERMLNNPIKFFDCMYHHGSIKKLLEDLFNE